MTFSATLHVTDDCIVYVLAREKKGAGPCQVFLHIDNASLLSMPMEAMLPNMPKCHSSKRTNDNVQ